MRNIIIILMLFSSNLIVAQTFPSNEEIIAPQIPTHVQLMGEPQIWTNKKTAQHQRIKGTGVYVIPPTGVTSSKNLAGLESDKIQFTVIETAADIQKQLDFFSEQELLKRGYTILEYTKNLTVNGYKAAFMNGTNGTSETIMFLMGDVDKIVIITANYPSNDKKTAKEVKNAIESIYWDKNEKQNPMENAAFVIDKNNQYVTFIGSNIAYFYSIKPQYTKDSSDLMIIQAEIFYEQIPKSDLERQLGRFIGDLETKGQKMDLKKYGFIKLKCGLKAYEVICDTEMGGQKGMAYLVIVEGKEFNYLLNFNTINSVNAKNIEGYRKVLDTFVAR